MQIFFHLQSRDDIQGRFQFIPKQLQAMYLPMHEYQVVGDLEQGISSKLRQNGGAISEANLLILVEFRSVTQCSWQPDTKSDQFLTHSC